MFYKVFPLQTEPRRCLVVGQDSSVFPRHTTASLAISVRRSFPEMTVYEMKGKPFIIVQADLHVPPPRRFSRVVAKDMTDNEEDHPVVVPKVGVNERRRRMGEFAIQAICRNENCRSEPVAIQRELTLEEKEEILKRHDLHGVAKRLRDKQTL